MKCLKGGKIITPQGILEDMVLIYDEKVQRILPEKDLETYDNIEVIKDLKGLYISPGFIDIHIHGIDGHDVCDGEVDGILDIAKGITRNGVTSFLPTTMTLKKERLEQILDTVEDAKEKQQQDEDGAQIIGVHLEGPFINKELKGAQDGTYIVPPDLEMVKKYKDIISLITLAPEVKGSLDFIEKVSKDYGIVISMGHTNATYDEAMKGIERGVTHSTHTFNAMSKLHHREPGVVGAALTSDVCCELIADKIHVHPALFKLMLRAKGLDKIILITDCVRAGGLPDGQYSLGGQKIFVKDGKSTLENGTIAGSVLKLNEAILNFEEGAEIPLSQAVQCVTMNPARSLGIDDKKGSIEIDKDADFAIFDEELNIRMTIGKGRVLYEK